SRASSAELIRCTPEGAVGRKVCRPLGGSRGWLGRGGPQDRRRRRAQSEGVFPTSSRPAPVRAAATGLTCALAPSRRAAGIGGAAGPRAGPPRPGSRAPARRPAAPRAAASRPAGRAMGASAPGSTTGQLGRRTPESHQPPRRLVTVRSLVLLVVVAFAFSLVV